MTAPTALVPGDTLSNTAISVKDVFVMGPSPGEIVDVIDVDLPRPRPIVLGESPEFGHYVHRTYRHFQQMGVLHGVELPTQGDAAS